MALPWTDVASTLFRIVAGFGLFYGWLAGVFFPAPAGMPRGDRFWVQALSMGAYAILLGYLLVALHVFEVLGWVVALGASHLLLAGRRRVLWSRYQLRPAVRLGAAVLEELDDLARTPARAWQRARGWISALRPRGRPSLVSVATGLLGLVILGVSAWMHFASNVAHAALHFADASVVVLWVKAVAEQRLFVDGVYPEGFHITLAALIKLTMSNPILFIKFVGPAIGVAMALSVAYFAARTSGRAVPALAALLVYGTLPALLPYEFSRQVGTDSQEFGHILVLPVAWLAYRSWFADHAEAYRRGALAGVLMAALVHPIAALNTAAAALAASIAAWLAIGIHRPTFAWYAVRVAAAALLAAAPLAAAWLMGVPLHASSLAFATSQERFATPPVSPWAWAGLAAPALSLVVRLRRRRSPLELGVPLLVLLTLGTSLCIQQAPRFGFYNTAILVRSGEFVALALAPALALGWSAVEEALEAWPGPAAARWVSWAALSAVTALAWRAEPPQSPHPYTMESDEFVAEYVHIAQTNRPTDWLAVSDPKGYAYALGQGFQLDPVSFVEHVVETADGLVYQDQSGTHPLPARIYLFVEKRWWVAPFPSEQAELPRRQAANERLKRWIADYSARHGPLPVVFDGRYLRVYELRQRPAAGGVSSP
ncbi:MAG: hypothetical protein IMW98_09410 [Firmicutes bacterium]|nr:hypothetical protein [Bacillota bacterium]